MNGNAEYGLWALVIINSAIFIIFAFSFNKPRTARDWRSFGAFSAFLIALFTERDAVAEFGGVYTSYMRRVPAFIPRWPDSNNQREREA